MILSPPLPSSRRVGDMKEYGPNMTGALAWAAEHGIVYAPNEKEIKYIDSQIKFEKELKEAKEIEFNYENELRKESNEKIEYDKGK